MKQNGYIYFARPGFSLAEILASVVIGSMVLIAALTVYSRAEHTAVAVRRTLSNSSLPYEVLQRIAEDFDKVVSTDSDTSVLIMNRHINDYAAPIFLIREFYKDDKNSDQLYKEIVWQCNTSKDTDANDIVLYRSYEALSPEDKLLDKNKGPLEKNAYVPICRGVTYFGIEIYTGKEKPETIWSGNKMPLGAVFKISFAKPYRNEKGQYEVPESEIYKRTIAFDKSRNIKFNISQDDSGDDEKNMLEVNPVGNESDLTKKPEPVKR